jgi:hypothetical protein
MNSKPRYIVVGGNTKLMLYDENGDEIAMVLVQGKPGSRKAFAQLLADAYNDIHGDSSLGEE